MAATMIVLILCGFLAGSHAVESLRFFIIGDMGGVAVEPYSTYFERCTAEEMGKMADLYSPQFILELGDNFYTDGVKSVDDMRFYRTFESVYTAKSLQVPWYLVAGNHDHHGNVTAQILYSNYSKRWNFPALYYYKEFPLGSSDEKIGIVFVDTVTLCGHTDDDSVKQPGGPENVSAAEEQWNFVQQSLKKSRASYLFTAGHYPVLSTATHGPTECLVKRLQPMLEAYNANGHLAGHEHNLQHLQVKSKAGNNIDYLISGMANTCDPFYFPEKDVPKGSSRFHYGNLLSKGGFLYAEATDKNITFTYMNGSGKRLYSTVVFPRKPLG